MLQDANKPGEVATLWLSIIVPTYNRPQQLRRCLASICRLNGDTSIFEVIVIDDGSRMNCQTIVEEEAANVCWRYLRQENRGPAAARNLGAAHAVGKFLVFLDDDCTLPKDWLTIVTNLLDERVLLGGRTINMLHNNLYASASQLLVDYLYDYYSRDTRGTLFLTSNNMIVPAVLFSQLGGFSSQFTLAAAEDRDFCDRWHEAGRMIECNAKITVEHWHDLDFLHFMIQHFRYGYGARIYHLRRKRRGGVVIRPEPMRFYYDLVCHPLNNQRNGKAIAMSILLLFSQLYNAAGYFWHRVASGPQKSI